MRTVGVGLLLAVSSLSSVAAEPLESGETVHLLGEVVVTGSNEEVSVSKLPYTVSVIGRERLESTGSTQVLSAISGMVPSLFVSERSIFGFGVSNGGSGHIKLRGVGGDRASAVLMMVDGQPQFAGIYSHHIADFYDKEYVERVEVLRGPGSVLYGSNAMAGAINIITSNPGRDGVRTTLTTQYGSYNTWLSSVTNTTRFGRFSSLASASYNRTDGNVDNFDFRQADGYAKVGYDLSDRWKVGADYTIMHFNGNDPIYPKLSNPESTDIYRQSITRGEASLSATNMYASTGGVARVYYSYGSHYVDDPRHFHSRDDRFGILLYQNFTPWRGASATAGFDFDTYSGKIPVSGSNIHTPGSMTTIDRKRITEYSPYITFAQSLINNRLNLNGGLRMANSDKFHTRWVPQFGASFTTVEGYNVKTNIAVGYRNPSFRELYLYRMANPDLQPEKMLNCEITVGRHFCRFFNIDVTAYYSRGSDMIQVLDNKNVNTGRFINKGIEITATSHPLDNLHLYATYSYLDTSLPNLTGAPKQQYYLGGELSLRKRWLIAADIKGIGSLYVADDLKRQSYALLNMKVTWKTCRYADIFLRLENLTDAHYTINRGYRMPGLTILTGLRLTL